MLICILYLFKNLDSILKRDKRNHHVSFVYLQSKEEEKSLFLKDSGHFMEQMTSYKKILTQKIQRVHLLVLCGLCYLAWSSCDWGPAPFAPSAASIDSMTGA